MTWYNSQILNICHFQKIELKHCHQICLSTIRRFVLSSSMETESAMLDSISLIHWRVWPRSICTPIFASVAMQAQLTPSQQLSSNWPSTVHQLKRCIMINALEWRTRPQQMHKSTNIVQIKFVSSIKVLSWWF